MVFLLPTRAPFLPTTGRLIHVYGSDGHIGSSVLDFVSTNPNWFLHCFFANILWILIVKWLFSKLFTDLIYAGSLTWGDFIRSFHSEFELMVTDRLPIVTAGYISTLAVDRKVMLECEEANLGRHYLENSSWWWRQARVVLELELWGSWSPASLCRSSKGCVSFDLWEMQSQSIGELGEESVHVKWRESESICVLVRVQIEQDIRYPIFLDKRPNWPGFVIK